jgi:AGCS family alanine or glycine:cation symporter
MSRSRAPGAKVRGAESTGELDVLDWIERLSDSISEIINSNLGPVADFLEGYVWAWPKSAPLLAVILLGTGLYVTIRLVFIQVRGFRHAIDITRGVYDDPKDEGDLAHFQALTTALSATVGIGNIAGVAIAIRLGGPGALFWMWVTAFFGMALKYSECTLAVAHRKLNADGSVSGGPMYYIEKGLGRSWKWMAIMFAALAMVASFGGGCMNQSNTLAGQVEAHFGVPTIYSAIVFSAIVAMVIIGGIRRIGRVTSILAPGMAAAYVLAALYILMVNFTEIPNGFALIFKNAFAPEPLVGGAAGSFLITLMWGIRRGLFSNEAGQGSAPIAHATAKTDEPVREGLVASLEPFIDTLVICTMTGLVIVMTGAYKEKIEQTIALSEVEAVYQISADDPQLIGLREAREAAGGRTIEVVDGRPVGATLFYLNSVLENARVRDKGGDAWTGRVEVEPEEGTLSIVEGTSRASVDGVGLLIGAPLTAQGFKHGLPGNWGNYVVTIAVVLFAVSTGISWSYYGDRATEYLFGSRAIPVYRWVFIVFFFLGSILPLKAVWTYGDVALGLMSLPNLIALILLSGSVAAMTIEYFSRKHVPFRQSGKGDA